MSISRLISSFQDEMRTGLAGQPRSIAMHPSFLGKPSGSERGKFLALDLGGTNVRATLVELGGERDIQVLESQSFRLASTSGSVDDLFGPVAEFVISVLGGGGAHSVGFIFAFPVDQIGVRSGRLTKWTKEFAFDGVEGQDVVSLLESAIRERSGGDSKITVGALANDTVGVLAAGAYLDPRCDIGLIVGTGANLAVAVPSDRIERKDLPAPSGGDMIFNMECGNFDRVGTFQTEADIRLDAESGAEGQLMEKMISGRYLGEVVRLRVLEEASRAGSFDGWLDSDGGFAVPYGLTTEHLSDVLFDESEDMRPTDMLLGRLGVSGSALKDRRLLKQICASVARRSARLVAYSIAATASHIDPRLQDDHIVAADGSLFRGMPGYQTQVERSLEEALGEKARRIRLCYLRDGSGLGAAVAAAVAQRT